MNIALIASCADKNHGAIHTAVADDNGRGKPPSGMGNSLQSLRQSEEVGQWLQVRQDGCRQSVPKVVWTVEAVTAQTVALSTNWVGEH